MKRVKINLTSAVVEVGYNSNQQSHSEPENSSLWRDPFIHILVILAAGFIVYLSSISVPFMFDDVLCLINNPVIMSFDCFPDTQKVLEYAIYPDLKNNLILRPVAYFTFALNYALHGFDLFGYHLVNLFLHIGCGLLVYAFFVQVLASPAISGDGDSCKVRNPDTSNFLPLFAALLFVCHPLQTQSVTYIIQRFVPLATFFYLSALVLYVHYRSSITRVSRITSYTLSLIAAVLAMESKEIAFTLPAVMVLTEFMFLGGGAVRVFGLIPFLLTMAIIPFKLMQLSSPVTSNNAEGIASAINLVNFGGVSSWDYLMSQFGVIVTYLRLLVMPIGQNLDYDYPLQQNFFEPEVLLPFFFLMVLAGTGFFLLYRFRNNGFCRIIAFGIFWFFITLSVESSFVPIEDLIFEHRVYLPSVGFFMSFLAGIAAIFKRFTGHPLSGSRIAVLLLLTLIVSLAATAVARNMVWQDELRFWNDVVSKSPNKPRAHLGLGEAFMRKAVFVPERDSKLPGILLVTTDSDSLAEKAVKAYKEAIRLGPKLWFVYVKLAEALTFQKKYDEALNATATALLLQPNSYLPYVTKGEIFEAKGEPEKARLEYLEAVRKDTFAPLPHKKLASIYIKEGNFEHAKEELELLMRIYPDELVRNELLKLKSR